MIDDFKHKGKRMKMIELLQGLGITNFDVLNEMNKIPRHLFIDSAFEEFAYQNTAFPIQANQTISQPFTVAFQTQLLNPKPFEKILEIGTGSGYQTAVLVSMKSHVYTIERQKSLFESSKKILSRLNLKPKYQVFGDGFKGLPAFAPFDKIIVTAGADEIPDDLLSQLKINGILIIPLGTETQIMSSFKRISENKFEKLEHGEYKFVPMLKNTQKDNIQH